MTYPFYVYHSSHFPTDSKKFVDICLQRYGGRVLNYRFNPLVKSINAPVETCVYPPPLKLRRACLLTNFFMLSGSCARFGAGFDISHLQNRYFRNFFLTDKQSSTGLPVGECLEGYPRVLFCEAKQRGVKKGATGLPVGFHNQNRLGIHVFTYLYVETGLLPTKK